MKYAIRICGESQYLTIVECRSIAEDAITNLIEKGIGLAFEIIELDERSQD